MKKLFQLVSIFLLLISLSGCFGIYLCTEGSGRLARQVYEVPSFRKVSVNLASDIFIIQDSLQKVEIETDDNLFNFLFVEVNNEDLSILSEKGLCPRRLNIFITTPNLNEIEINGSSDIIAQSPIFTDYLNIEINGAGDIIFDSLKVGSLNVVINGSGDIRVGGITDSFSVQINGSGDVHALNLISKSVQIETNGSGDVYVHSLENLDVGIHGSGDVYYLGNPSHSNIEISGSGSAKRFMRKPKN